MSTTTTVNYQGGILLKNTNFCFKNKQKNGYVFISLCDAIYDINKTLLLYTNSKIVKNAKENLYVIVTLNVINNTITLHKIVGVISDLNNQIKILVYNNYIYPINTKRELCDNVLNSYTSYINNLQITNNICDVITIDSPKCKCMDNAISYDCINEMIVIHISDPNVLHNIYPLNKYYDNYISIYLSLFNIPLLPTELCLDLLTLKENTIRPVISIYFDISNFKLIKVIRQNILITKNLTYTSANDIMRTDQYNMSTLFKLSKYLEHKYYSSNKILKDTRDMNELYMILTNDVISELLDLPYNFVNKTITAPLRRTADFINHQKLLNKIGFDVKNKYEINNIEYFDKYLSNIKIISDKAKYLVIANEIINNTYYLCKLLDIYKETQFTWYLCKYDIKFTCELCDVNFFKEYKSILDSLIINEYYKIKLFKVVVTKYKFIKIMFEF